MSNQKGLSLYEAAKSSGDNFSKEWVPSSNYIKANGLNFHYLEWGENLTQL